MIAIVERKQRQSLTKATKIGSSIVASLQVKKKLK